MEMASTLGALTEKKVFYEAKRVGKKIQASISKQLKEEEAAKS